MIGHPPIPLPTPFFVAMGDTFLLLVQYQHCSRFVFPLSRPISTSTFFVSFFCLISVLFPFISLSKPYFFTLFFIKAQQSVKSSSFMSRFLLAHSPSHLSAAGLTYILAEAARLVFAERSLPPPPFLGQWDVLREKVSLHLFLLCPKATCVTRTIPNHSADTRRESICSK